MAPRMGSRKAGIGPGSLGGKVKPPKNSMGLDISMGPGSPANKKSPFAPKKGQTPAFKKGGKVKGCC